MAEKALKMPNKFQHRGRKFERRMVARWAAKRRNTALLRYYADDDIILKCSA